jgi:SNF2 family DNA or RNA helicase
MDIDVPKLQTRTMRRAPDPASYELYRAALEWDLIDPILIRDREDLKSEPKWREHIKPYHHQIKNLVTFCRRLPVTLLADDVGLGKTISAGLIASELMSRGRLSKILVVCPKLLMPQWKEELESKFGIIGIEATGKELLEARVPDGGGAVITTYQSARMYLDALSQSGFEMLVLDEAHKLRNLYGTNQAPQVAQRFREALANRVFKYVLMLTATPIQNRLWDIYSLVDLLAVARGHQNPFGSDGMFARTFIADDRGQARQLVPYMRERFRSIVYTYMSRIRRADANLHFPERIVQLHRVAPLPEELELIDSIRSPIQGLNRLAQISILQALISSPHALLSQLRRMAENGTVPKILTSKVEEIVGRISTTAKLQGLGNLVDQLRAEQPEHWRAVIFTTRRETQTTIESFLQTREISCGLINGDSGARNQQTITKFRKSPPEIHVIVSTEAGSEGVNLQAANVLVNFDLPWNPMIVEQRIGRIQRLASEHASVCIFNMILRGTFEEYIVGRLMEKLQMASHAIGDIEALLEAAGMDDQGEDSLAFGELIRQLVLASLAGKNVEETTRLAEESIAAAKVELESQEKTSTHCLV